MSCSYVLRPTASIFIVCFVGFVSVYVYNMFVYLFVFAIWFMDWDLYSFFWLSTVKDRLELVHVYTCAFILLFLGN